VATTLHDQVCIERRAIPRVPSGRSPVLQCQEPLILLSKRAMAQDLRVSENRDRKFPVAARKLPVWLKKSPCYVGRFSPRIRGRAKVRNCKSIFHFPGTPDLPSGDHRLSVYPAVDHITVDLMGTDRVRRHSHPAIDPPLPTASPTLPALIGSRSPSPWVSYLPGASDPHQIPTMRATS
jgi:hypothetical protein